MTVDTTVYDERHVPPLLTRVITPIAALVLNSAAEGALPTLRAATDPDARGGDYFGPVGMMEIARSAKRVNCAPQARSREDAERLWVLSEKLTGVNPFAALAS